jgi:hypothetical protein
MEHTANAGIQTLRDQQHGKARPEQVIEELTWLLFCLTSWPVGRA